MAVTPGYREEDGFVVLTMTDEDWGKLLLVLGYAIGTYQRDNEKCPSLFALVNRMNAGNPNFTSYEIPKEERT